MLNLPIMSELNNRIQSKNILIAGAGGGFDVFAGLPIGYTLNAQGFNCIYFNYSFTDLSNAEGEEHFYYKPVGSSNAVLYGFKGCVRTCPKRKEKNYFPEGYLSEFDYQQKYPEQTPSFDNVKMFYASPKIGVSPLKKAYEHLITKEKIDTIILVDGGVDSLMQGDEVEGGTILEDTVSLAAIKDLPVRKYLATLGFGTEIDDRLDHYFVLKNMAQLMNMGALYGSCCLTKNQDSFRYMKNAYEYVIDQENHAESHITPRIIKAVDGYFGGNNSKAELKDNRDQHFCDRASLQYFIQPLMNLYWFWDVDAVVQNNKLITKEFCNTNTFTDVNIVYRQEYANFIKREKPQDNSILF